MIVDVVGVGNAIVDVIAKGSDEFLISEGLVKGSMSLIDEDVAQARYSRMGPAIEMSGGSVANSIAEIASLGAKAGFLGKIADDSLGRIFRHDLESLGIAFTTSPLRSAASTARCLIAVSPDGQRTMSTYLGACTAFGSEDLDRELIQSARILYLEGYLFDPPKAKQAFFEAVQIAKASGTRVALSLSDAFCVDRHREDFIQLLERVDIVFGNESEAQALFPNSQPQASARQIRELGPIAVITAGVNGSVIHDGSEPIRIAARPAKVVDTTGAGDSYAAGFLFGLSQNWDLAGCGELGSRRAARTIGHYGARSISWLQKFRKKFGPPYVGDGPATYAMRGDF